MSIFITVYKYISILKYYRFFENDIYLTTIHRSGGGWWWIFTEPPKNCFFTNQNSEIIQHKEMIHATITTFSGASSASIREVKSKVFAKFE